MIDGDDLFQTFEERQPRCRATPVTIFNVDRLASFYNDHGYEASVIRPARPSTEVTHLVLAKADAPSILARVGDILIAELPPRVVREKDREAFTAQWRRIKDDADA